MKSESRKNRLMVFFILLMAAYFIGINFLDEIDKKNENNTYVSMNLQNNSKEEYIEEYIKYIQNSNYQDAFYMLDDTTRSKFGGSILKFTEYAKTKYEGINKEAWKFKIDQLSNEKFRNETVYTYKVLDGEDKETVYIDKITIYEYAVNVFKLHLEGV